MSANDRFVSPDDVDSQVFDWGVLKWMVTPEVNGSERISCGVVKLEPGKGHERHTHPDSDEMLYVVRGEGEQEIADETRDVSAGDMLYVPQGVEHGTVNTGWEPLVLIAVYAPPGPEDVLADLPECTVVPAGELPTPENADRYADGSEG
jgi:oxalate decarboxylase/phosphoglucose isomerase-like protein (cupin superfamily)